MSDFVAMTPASSFITDHSAVLLLRLLSSLMLDFISLLTRHSFLCIGMVASIRKFLSKLLLVVPL